jgi:hypothetical protein
MADNTLLNPATSTGDTIATDDIGGVKYQRVKMTFGVDGAAVDVSSTAPVPVTSTGVTIINPTTAVSISNPATAVSAFITNSSTSALYVLSTGVTIANPTTVVSISNPATAVSALIVNTSTAALYFLSTGVTIANPTTTVTVGNPTTAVSISNPTTAVSISNPTTNVSAVTLATVSNVGAYSMTDLVYGGLTAYTPLFARIAASTAGNTTLVAGSSNKKIRVLAMAAIASSAVNIIIIDGATSALFGSTTVPIALTANSGFVLPYNPVGWFETASTQPLIVNLSASQSFAGSLTYITSS